MTEGLIQRETNSEITPPPERVTAGGNGKRWQRSGTSIGRRGEINLVINSDLKEEKPLGTPRMHPTTSGCHQLNADIRTD
ncbi:hypothetical protein E3U43_007648 [Larimichthys crocea]|uniref:Uncharacterized protein n=1 Tax=Larimichthys crocea TaxID=215358 RepID=A0ACD3Q6F9_LARCR|nr:hypothetical protein E3U43_007648 [Larimichthys crocea]